jgi:hypothetical protein
MREGWLMTSFGRFGHEQEARLPTVQEAVWVLGPVWTSTENLTPTGT